MKALVDGPWWAGKWTEMTADELRKLGFDVQISYHNRKSAPARIVKRVNQAVPATRSLFKWEDFGRRALFNRLKSGRFDLFFCIQGKIDSEFLMALKTELPAIRTVFWLGDVLIDKAKIHLDTLKQASLCGALDEILVSYKGVFDYLQARGFQNLRYFPFGYSETFHRTGLITEKDRRRFSGQVSFVGTCYPERAEIISFLNKHLKEPVRVWGRSWNKAGIQSRGPLSLQDSLKVHACSAISLNIHHHLTDNGFNMKFYEIPAAGGFQICDYQAEISNSPLKRTPVYIGREELLEIILEYSRDETKRRNEAAELRDTVFQECNYSKPFRELACRTGFLQDPAYSLKSS